MSIRVFKMKRLRKILRVSWTAQKTDEWVLNKAGVKKELLDIDTVKARKLASCGHTMRKQGSCLGKGIMQRTMPDALLIACARHYKHWTLFDETSLQLTKFGTFYETRYKHGVQMLSEG